MSQHTQQYMQENKRLQKRNVIITSAVIFAMLLLIALIYNITALVSRNVRNNRLERELYAIIQLIEENDGHIAFRNSPEFIEDFARRYLEMRHPNESIFIAR